MKDHVLAIDQGTTGSTVLILDRELNVKARTNQEFPQIYPKPGWVEHDPDAIWESVVVSISQALARSGITGDRIAAIGITNQRETTLIWDRNTGKPIHNAIVWQCRRTADICRALKEKGLEETIRQRTGLVLDPYFSGTKITWLLEQYPEHRRAAREGKLAMGTMDSYLIWRLTAGEAHVTDTTNASRTLLMDLDQCQWDEELLEMLGVPAPLLPEIRSSSTVFGSTKAVPGLPDGIPISGLAGDQQAALFGQACFKPGESKCTYGTGAFVLLNTGETAVRSQHGLLSTVAWTLNGKTTYALEGSAFIAGAIVQWLRDGLHAISSSSEVEGLADQVDNSMGVVFVPALVGLGAPYWRPDARGSIQGITRGTTMAHIARAALEGIAFEIKDILDAMAQDSGVTTRSMKVDGGASANNILLQFQADILRNSIIRPAMLDTTALGAAFLAGLAVGMWQNQEQILQVFKEDRRFEPTMAQETATCMVEAWRKAVQQA